MQDQANSAAECTPARQPPVRRFTRRIARYGAVALLAYLLVVLLAWAMENSLIYFPAKYPEGVWNPPGLEFEDAWFTASDGTRLHGWYVPSANPRAVILFAHGNAGNLSHRYELLQELSKLGISTMIFDYRGYGRSEGSPSEAGILDDARAARHWLAQRAGVREADIVLMGESLGGGVMVDLAARDGARGLILENTFTSLPEVAAYHYPWLPVRMLMQTQLNSAAKIHNYHGPLLQIHGDADTIIPFAIGQQLFAAANEPKELVVIAGGDHNDPRTPQHFEAIDQFLNRLPRALGDTSEEHRAQGHHDHQRTDDEFGDGAEQATDERRFADLETGIEIAPLPRLAEHCAGQGPQSAEQHRTNQGSHDRDRQSDE